MSNLPQQIKPALPETPGIYKVLANGLKVRDISATDVKDFIIEKVALTVFESGQGATINQEDLPLIIQGITSEIFEKYSGLTLNEIAEAFKRGVRKEFGAYYGLSIVTFNDWLRAYKNMPERKAQLTTVPKLDKCMQSKEITEAEKEAIAIEAYNFCFDAWKRTKGNIYDSGNAVYAWLDRQGKLNNTAEYKIRVINEVTEAETARLNKKISDLKMAMDRHSVAKAETELNELLSNKNIAISLAKKRLLAEYFETLIKNIK